MPHVFISYVRENRELVDRLCEDLTSHGIEVWLDRNSLPPGVQWRPAIRRAIRAGAFFIACFSSEYNERLRNQMNQELRLAIEELQLHPDNEVWFIPVKLNECQIPDIDIGAGKTLLDINYVNLYEDWDGNIQRILRVIQPESFVGQEPTSSEEPDRQPTDISRQIESAIESDTEVVNLSSIIPEENSQGIDMAIEAYSATIAHDPNHAGAHRQRGMLYLSTGMYEEAFADFNRTIELNSQDVVSYFARSLIYEHEHEYELAIIDANKAIELGLEDPTIYYHRGRIYTLKEEHELAFLDYNRAIELNLENATVYYLRGLIYAKRGEYDLAIQDIDKAIELRPDYTEAHYYRGEIYRLNLRIE